MSLDQKRIRRRILRNWICTVLAGAVALGNATFAAGDDFDDFLNAANAFQVEAPMGIGSGSAVPNVNETPAVDGFVPEAAKSVMESSNEGMIAETEDAASDDEESEESGDDDLTGEIEALSEKLAALQGDWDDYQGDLKAEAAAKKKKSSYKLGGRIHMDYWSFADNDDGINVIENEDANIDPESRFSFRRLRLELAGEVPQNMVWRMQLEASEPNSLQFRDAYIGWTNLPNNQTLLLGNQKRPLGLDHQNSSRYNVFTERPMAIEAFNEDARRFGLAMYGHNDEESVGWAYGIYGLENIQDDGESIGDSLQMGGYARTWSSPWYDETSGGRGYLHLGLAGALARPDGDVDGNDTNNNEGRFRTRASARSNERWLNTTRIPGADWYQHVAVESILNLGSLQLTGEYIVTPMQREGTPDSVTPTNPNNLPGFAFDDSLSRDLFFHGGYIYASYFLTGEHIPYKRTSGTIDRVKPHENFFLVDRMRGGRGAGWGAWQVAARYDYLDLSSGGVNGGVGHIITGALNWHWTPYSKVQNNLIYGNIDQSGVANAVGGAGVEAGDFLIFGSRFMLDF